MSTAPAAAVVFGLGFGDCGKGRFTDALCRQWPVHTVVRYNGGAQAGHNVVLADGTHHTFSQLGSGSFVHGVFTVLASPVVVHPMALALEVAELQRKGVPDIHQSVLIDERCRLTTPYHQAAGQLRELLRGAQAHGSCGVGFGETVHQALCRPELAVRYGELARPAQVLPRLHALREALVSEFSAHELPAGGAAAQAWASLQDAGLAARWLVHARELSGWAAPCAPEQLQSRLSLPGTVLMEGAQGMLLDERHGFHPHTTWSSVGPQAAAAVLAELGVATGALQRLGVLRSYLTRHGAGPLPTHDPALDATLPEPHNLGTGWQGAFRRGHPDAVLLRHAVRAAGGIDGLLLSHADVFERGARLHWCEQHRTAAGQLISTLDAGLQGEPGTLGALTEQLMGSTAVLGAQPLQGLAELLDHLRATAGAPVRMLGHGLRLNALERPTSQA